MSEQGESSNKPGRTLTRRNFLKGAAAGAAGLLLSKPAKVLAGVPDSEKDKYGEGFHIWQLPWIKTVFDQIPTKPQPSTPPPQETRLAPELKNEKGYQFLNGGCLLMNHHELLFIEDQNVVNQDIAYAARMGAKVMRVFATDTNFGRKWDGETIGNRISSLSGALRANGIKLIVSFVNNHQAVPGENPESIGHFGGYTQLTEAFYQKHWEDAYKKFTADIVSTVARNGVKDTIFAWEVGNEMHTPDNPRVFLDFFKKAVAHIRSLDPGCRIAPGTMGINHLEPGNPNSPAGLEFYHYLARIGSFITLHCYDFVVENGKVAYWGDMPVHWDLDLIRRNGISLPAVVEEIGFSKKLGQYFDENGQEKRVQFEAETVRYLLDNGATGFGPWSGSLEAKWGDTWRGLSSYPGESIFQKGDSGSPRANLERIYASLPKRP